jgi:ABC-type Fe3+/spermidine/putrescine transport system ATPase subunit
MNQGKISQEGDPTSIYEKPANKFVADFIGLTNFLVGEVAETSDSSGFSRVKLNNGEIISCKVSTEIKKNHSVTLSVRPEHIEIIERENSTGINTISATIKRKVYLGNFYEYWLEIDNKNEIRVQTHTSKSFEVNDKISALLNPSKIIVILN